MQYQNIKGRYTLFVDVEYVTLLSPDDSETEFILSDSLGELEEIIEFLLLARKDVQRTVKDRLTKELRELEEHEKEFKKKLDI